MMFGRRRRDRIRRLDAYVEALRWASEHRPKRFHSEEEARP